MDNYEKVTKIINCLAETKLEKEEEIFLLDEVIKCLEKNRCVLVGEKLSVYRRKKILRLRKTGLIQTEIAKQTEVSQQYVCKILNSSRARIPDFSCRI